MATNKHPKEGKTCMSCGHLIYWLKGRGYRCMCDKAVTYAEFKSSNNLFK